MNKSDIKVGNTVTILNLHPKRDESLTRAKGKVVSLTTVGAYVQHDKAQDKGEWFPFTSNELQMIKGL